MKIALIQMNSGRNKAKNIKYAIACVEEAAKKKAHFIALPEVFNCREKIFKGKGLQGIAEAIPGESTRPFCELAKQRRVTILLGSLAERIPGSAHAYNTSVFITSTGTIAARYRKISLFDAVIGKKVLQESQYIKAGTKTVTACVGGFKLGLSICYDLRFPQIYRRYLKAGCDMIAVPSAFTHQTGKAHWEVLLRARAIENLSYVIAPNQVGQDARGVLAHGHSMIISPWGEVLARGSAGRTEILYAHVTKKDLIQARRRLPAIVFAKQIHRLL